jgi:hypothetical protein
MLVPLAAFIVLFLAQLGLGALGRNVRPRIVRWLLDPRRVSRNERDPYWNREYARPSSPATTSPRPWPVAAPVREHLANTVVTCACGLVGYGAQRNVWPGHGAGVATLLTILVAGALLVLFAGAAGVRRLWSWFSDRWRIGKRSGISRVYPVQGYPGTSGGMRSVGQFTLALEGLRGVVAAEPELRFLLVSGFKHFGGGRHTGWIEEALLRREKSPKILVLLLDPGAPAARERASETYGDALRPDDYCYGIETVLWKLRGWKRERGFDIEVRLYQEPPIWQMVVTPREVWLLCAPKVRVENSPVYCLRRNDPYTLAYGLEAVWERRWGGALPFDLDGMAEPQDFAKIVVAP